MTATLFLPGAGGSAEFWQPLVSHLAMDDLAMDATLLSWPGLGAEPHAAEVSAIDDLVALVQSHMSEPVNLVAQSIGGVVAAKAALHDPSLVRRLTLIATSAGVPFDAMGIDMAAADWRPEYRQAFPNAARWVETVEVDLSEQLKTLQIPTLLIWGDRDPISPVAVGRYIDSLLPDSGLHIISGGDHDLAQTHAADVAALITTHLEA